MFPRFRLQFCAKLVGRGTRLLQWYSWSKERRELVVRLPDSEDWGVFVGGIAFSLQDSGLKGAYREKTSPEFLFVRKGGVNSFRHGPSLLSESGKSRPLGSRVRPPLLLLPLVLLVLLPSPLLRSRSSEPHTMEGPGFGEQNQPRMDPIGMLA